MTHIHVFPSPEFGRIRTTTINGEPWFVAADVCKALGISNHKDAITALDDDEKDGVGITDPIDRTQRTNIINEPGLYSLVLRSRKPQAKAFKRWITHEVIPAIRKHGAYSLPGADICTYHPPHSDENPDQLIARALIAAHEKIGTLTEQVEHAQEAIQFTATVKASTDTISVDEMARLITQSGRPINRVQLYAWMRDHDYVCKTKDAWNLPRKHAIECGWLVIKENTHAQKNKPNNILLTRQTMITGKGQVFFLQKFRPTKQELLA